MISADGPDEQPQQEAARQAGCEDNSGGTADGSGDAEDAAGDPMEKEVAGPEEAAAEAAHVAVTAESEKAEEAEEEEVEEPADADVRGHTENAEEADQTADAAAVQAGADDDAELPAAAEEEEERRPEAAAAADEDAEASPKEIEAADAEAAREETEVAAVAMDAELNENDVEEGRESADADPGDDLDRRPDEAAEQEDEEADKEAPEDEKLESTSQPDEAAADRELEAEAAEEKPGAVAAEPSALEVDNEAATVDNEVAAVQPEGPATAGAADGAEAQRAEEVEQEAPREEEEVEEDQAGEGRPDPAEEAPKEDEAASLEQEPQGKTEHFQPGEDVAQQEDKEEEEDEEEGTALEEQLERQLEEDMEMAGEEGEEDAPDAPDDEAEDEELGEEKAAETTPEGGQEQETPGVEGGDVDMEVDEVAIDEATSAQEGDAPQSAAPQEQGSEAGEEAQDEKTAAAAAADAPPAAGVVEEEEDDEDDAPLSFIAASLQSSQPAAAAAEMPAAPEAEEAAAAAAPKRRGRPPKARTDEEAPKAKRRKAGGGAGGTRGRAAAAAAKEVEEAPQDETAAVQSALKRKLSDTPTPARQARKAAPLSEPPADEEEDLFAKEEEDLQQEEGAAEDDGHEEEECPEAVAEAPADQHPSGDDALQVSWHSRPDCGMVELKIEGHSEGWPFLLPQTTFDSLYPYQRQGVAWMAGLQKMNSGGILADEMGLGKTVQICAYLAGARKAGATHALLLLPLTLMDQWAKEAKKWCPGWPVFTYHGTAAQRAQALRRMSRPTGGILISTYTVLSNNTGLFDVSVDDAPSPRRRGGAPVKKPSKRQRLLLHDDEGDEVEESEDEQCDPEIPPSGLPASGQRRPWDVVICDEAHKLKGISTLLGKSLRQLKSKTRLLLTGTPVQNSLQDLWGLMDFAKPGLLGNHATFMKHFGDPISRGSLRAATVFQVQLKKHLTEQLQSLTRPHLLRRTKAMVGLIAPQATAPADGECAAETAAAAAASTEDSQDAGENAKALPPKRETIVWLAPTEEQVAAYQKVLERSEIIKEACSKGKLGVEVFRAIGLLKRLCNHPALLLRLQNEQDWNSFIDKAALPALKDAPADDAVAAQPADMEEEAADDAEGQRVEAEGSLLEEPAAARAADDDDMSDAEEGEGDVAVEDDTQDARLADEGECGDEELAEQSVEELLEGLPRDTASLLSQSAKLRCLQSLLPALASRGHRTLVFSQSLKMLDLIQLCCLKPHGLKCLRMDGKTGKQARAAKVAKFNRQRDRFQVMLLTTQVGGVGLNLTSADRVVLVDPSWNPAADAQAVDRAFRIGQEKAVKVYRLIMSGLIEDKMFRLQVFKMGLSKAALEVQQQQCYFTDREIKALFEWTDPALGETRRLLDDQHAGEESRSGAVHESAEQDGAVADDWMNAGPAVALSDLGVVLSNAVSKDTLQKQNNECSERLSEAKRRLNAAEEKLQAASAQKQAAETHREKVSKDIEEVGASIDAAKEQRPAADEELKKKRGELAQAKKAEGTASQKTESARQYLASLEEQQPRTDDSVSQAEQSEDAHATCVIDASTALQSLLDSIALSFDEPETQLGGGVYGDMVDASEERLRDVVQGFERARGSLSRYRQAQKDLELAAEAVNAADAKLRKAHIAKATLEEVSTNEEGEEVLDEDLQLCEQRRTAEWVLTDHQRSLAQIEHAFAEAQRRADLARDEAFLASKDLADAGSLLAGSFRRAGNAGSMRSDQVKAAGAAVKASFKRIVTAWQPVKKALESWSKAFALRRKASQKLSSAASAQVEMTRWLSDAQRALEEAVAEESTCKEARGKAAAALEAAEASKSSLEAKYAEEMQRRKDLKAALTEARQACKAAQQAEKEALGERTALHNECSKVEQAHDQMEDAKSSAVSNLRKEKYNQGQVQQAYKQASQRKKGGGAAAQAATTQAAE
eukprot:TRINITY_DN907_c0_g2_i1.p1 TRINITY_DN907_c0_g2~~TRINITY_DN907_c0_g2_i1.p1  ORF type:complete len:1937 (+),score=753.68 TRINITY_DN907_c0_g2_i1:111-5921(+)